MAETTLDYNEILIQISVNLTNALNTFGPASPQYQCILQILKQCLRDIEEDKERNRRDLDPVTLSVALEFLEIGERC
ncbi:hypothetical protein BO94DRAFT_533199 [Aspergillus sclerotioniger CBS 115572]|uniref:Uncharacterized protein n=1 Tax=Aspergillus sclerotioniger CBS 115572 TaxID=1450535 RepID=A0A317X0P5_9EURO|nr:hypothetical protein BO94DRAFT_533199 [Aspergillus sclerotioniger CBS 115572]PWY91741.1 hypothetical protein BO94DRAFT_533199 [Aspergillus sclerotioniger CBS 115572]